MEAQVGELHRAIDHLAAAAPTELSDSELHELVLDLAREQRRLDAVRSEAIAAWDARNIWTDNGSRSAGARLATDLHQPIGTSRADVRRARRLRTMPATAAAHRAGEIGADHVDLLARANSEGREALFAEHEDSLVEYCRTLRYLDARRAIDYWCQRADATAATERADHLRERAHLNVSSTIDGTVVVNGVLDPVAGEIVADELRRLERELYETDQRNGVIRTASQRKAAALVEMATRSRTAPADGKRPVPLITFLVGNDATDHVCELASGTVIPPSEVARWAGDAQIESVLFDGPSTVISVSHRRTFTGALRRAIQVRDRRCQHRSGCDERGDECDVDHIVAHRNNGRTTQFNGKLECSPHNRNPDRHVDGEPPRPEPARPIDRLDELRCRLRWRYLREIAADNDTDAEPDPLPEPSGRP